MTEPESKLEQALWVAMQETGLPQPLLQFQPVPERRWRVDFAWPEAQMIAECEGAIWAQGRHTGGEGFQEDCHKYGRMVAEGWRVLRVTVAMVANGEAVELIRQCLGR